MLKLKPNLSFWVKACCHRLHPVVSNVGEVRATLVWAEIRERVGIRVEVRAEVKVGVRGKG